MEFDFVGDDLPDV